MRCECGRFSVYAICDDCLGVEKTLGERGAGGVEGASGKTAGKGNGMAGQEVGLTAPCSPSVYVIPRVERTGMLCSCGEPESMAAEVGFWLDDGGEDLQRVAYAYPAELLGERLLWFRCVACGSVTRETLVPAAL